MNKPENVSLMTGASNEDRPAAEIVADHLFERFGDNVRENRVKQFTGFLIRQVMKKMDISIMNMGDKLIRTLCF